MDQEKLNIKWATFEGFVDRIHLPEEEHGVIVVPGVVPPNEYHVFCNSKALADRIHQNLQDELDVIPHDGLGVRSFGGVEDIKRSGLIIFTDPIDPHEDDADIKPLHLLTALAAAGFQVNVMSDVPWE